MSCDRVFDVEFPLDVDIFPASSNATSYEYPAPVVEAQFVITSFTAV
jgi:hypothetical protein